MLLEVNAFVVAMAVKVTPQAPHALPGVHAVCERASSALCDGDLALIRKLKRAPHRVRVSELPAENTAANSALCEDTTGNP